MSAIKIYYIIIIKQLFSILLQKARSKQSPEDYNLCKHRACKTSSKVNCLKLFNCVKKNNNDNYCPSLIDYI